MNDIILNLRKIFCNTYYQYAHNLQRGTTKQPSPNISYILIDSLNDENSTDIQKQDIIWKLNSFI